MYGGYSNLQRIIRDERIGIAVHALKSGSKNRLSDGKRRHGGAEANNHFALLNQIWQTACVLETNFFSPTCRCCAAAFAAPPHFVSSLHQRGTDSLPHGARVKQPYRTTHSRPGDDAVRDEENHLLNNVIMNRGAPSRQSSMIHRRLTPFRIFPTG